MKFYEVFCTIRSLVLIGIVVALIIVLTGCGDDKTTSNNDSINIKSIEVESIEVEQIEVEGILTEDILTEEIR